MKRKLLSFVLCILLLGGTVMAYAVPNAAPENISWPQGQAMPSFAAPAENLDMMSTNALPFSEYLTLTSLQGLANREQPRILAHNGESWPADMGLFYTETDGLLGLIAKYRSVFQGLVIYNPELPDTINVATTAAGVYDLLVVSPEMAQVLTAAPYNYPVEIDLRDAPITNIYEAYDYIYNNYWAKCERRLLFGFNTHDHTQLRDLSVAVRGAVLWLDPKDAQSKAIMDKFFGEMDFGAYYAGWWQDEGAGIRYATEYGMPTVPSDFYMNYTVYSGLPRYVAPPEIPAKPALQDGKIYVSLNFSDGDNIQYNQHSMPTAKLWGSPRRGEVPIGWTCSPMLLDAGPGLLNYYYRTATPNDVLICGPSGAGYTNTAYWHMYSKELKNYTAVTNDYFERTGMNIITVWGEMYPWSVNYYTRNIPALLGMTLQERLMTSVLHTTSGTPVVWLGSNLTNAGLTYESETEKAFNELSLIAQSNPEKATFVGAQFVAWSVSVDDLAALADELNAAYPGKFEFVRTDHLMMLINESANKPINRALQAQATASGSAGENTPDKAVNGTFATGWAADKTGESWLQIDLGASYELNRYVLKNAGANALDASLNSKAWEIQVSGNGEDWQTVSCQSGSSANNVYKDFFPRAVGRYVRVKITDPGADGIARIQDIELYGVPAATPQEKVTNAINRLPDVLNALFLDIKYFAGVLYNWIFGGLFA